jgi:hypothetical protein
VIEIHVGPERGSTYSKTLPERKSSVRLEEPKMMSLFSSRSLRNAPSDLEPGRLRFRIAPDVKASLHPDGVILMHIGRGTVFSANLVGARIWSGAAERWSMGKLAASLSGEFHIPPEIAQRDATEFLEQLQSEGLLVPDAN